MTKIETEKMILKNSYGISQNGDFAADGIIKSDLEKQFHDGIITRICYGFYQCADYCKISEAQCIAGSD